MSRTDDGASAPRISVITVCFNSARTIADTLRSVAEQTLPGVQHVVVDGGSTDGTQDIIGGFPSRSLQWQSEPDRGIYDAMNKGVALARGDIVCFLNADDYYASPDVLRNVSACFDAEELDAVFGDVAFFHPGQPDRIVRRYRSGRFAPNMIGWGWMPAHPALFVRRRLFEQKGAFKIDYRIAGDFEWIARVFHTAPMHYRYLPDVLVHMQTGGISTQGWRATLRLNQEVMRACRENGISTNWFKLLSKYPAKLLEFVRA